MEKPLSLKREDFLQSIIEDVNKSGLPACVALEVLKGIVNEVALLAKRQYEQDLMTYNEEANGNA